MSAAGWREFAGEYRAVWSLGILFGVGGPLGMWRASLDPPWPAEARWVAMLLCGVTAVIAYLAAQTLAARGGGGKAARAQERHWKAGIASVAMLLGMVASLVYLHELGLSVVEETQPSATGERQIRVVAGAERVPELRNDRRPDKEVLQDHLYSPEEVWTASSLLRSRMYLLGLYVAAFCLLTFGLSFAVLWMAREPGRRA